VLLPDTNTAVRETSQRIWTYLCALFRSILIPFQCVCFTQFVTHQYNIYSPPSIIRVNKSRRMTWAGHAARMGESRGACMVLMGRPEGKKPLGIPRRWWEANFKIDLQKMGSGSGLDCSGSAQWQSLVNEAMNFRVPWNAGNFLTSWANVWFSGRAVLHGVSQIAS